MWTITKEIELGISEFQFIENHGRKYAQINIEKSKTFFCRISWYGCNCANCKNCPTFLETHSMWPHKWQCVHPTNFLVVHFPSPMMKMRHESCWFFYWLKEESLKSFAFFVPHITTFTWRTPLVAIMFWQQANNASSLLHTKLRYTEAFLFYVYSQNIQLDMQSAWCVLHF